MTQEELNEILEQHKLWLDAKGEEGKRADLRYADLRGADLRNADLRGADLRYAYLTGANLEGTGVCFFIGPKHKAVYNSKDDKLYIGCQVDNLDYWLKNYVAIGKKHGYTYEEIEVYGTWIKSLKEVPK